MPINTGVEETPEAKVDPNVTIDTSMIKRHETGCKTKHAKIEKVVNRKSQENLSEFYKR
jgi:hypothetical protein